MRYLCLLLLSFPTFLIAQNFVGKQKVMDPNRSIFSFMGHAVELSNDYAFVAAPESPYDTAGANPIGQSGVVLVYQRQASGRWNLTQKLQSSSRNNGGQFGWSLHAEDSLLVVGARGEWVGFPAGGAAHVFRLKANGRWEHQQRIIPNDTAFQGRFGESVAISYPYIIVGAEKNDLDSTNANALLDAGAAYIFEKTGAQWQQMDKLSPNQGRVSTAYFGRSVAIHGDRALVGSPRAWLAKPSGGYLYAFGLVYEYARQANGSWNQVSMLLDTIGNVSGGEFGERVILTDSLAFISAIAMPIDTVTSAGIVTVMKRTGNNNWTAIQDIQAIYPFDNDFFGTALDYDDGNLIVGVEAEDHDQFNQNPMAGAGSAYWFSLDPQTDSLHIQHKILPQDRLVPNSTFDFFGCDVAIDAGYLLVGARNDDDDTLNLTQTNAAGTAYFFDTICPATAGGYNAAICEGDSILFGNQYLKSGGSYTTVLTAQSGCDSIVTLSLTLLNKGKDSIAVSECISYTVPSGTRTLFSSGIYKDTLLGANACDSILTINLNILGTSTTSFTDTACKMYPYPSGAGVIKFSGQYFDTLVDIQGCDSILDMNITINNVDTALLVDQVKRQIITIAGNASFRWLDCENNYAVIPGFINDTSTFVPGTYAVEITQNGCVDTSRCVVLRPSGLSTELQHNDLSIYPNPAKDQIQISWNAAVPLEHIEVFSAKGELLKQVEQVKPGHLLSLDLKDGVYLIKLTFRGGLSHERKLIIDQSGN